MIRRLLVAAALVLPALQAQAAPAPVSTVTEVREVFSPDGTISRVRVTLPRQKAAAAASPGREVVHLQVSGPSATALDLVIVGDGYTRSQRDLFLRHARSKVAEFFSVEPYKAYRGMFNVWAVVVVSPQSGVDNDPSLGVTKDTALDMGFFCGGTERLLCADDAKAKAAAQAAPAADLVLALANSTKYGGAGGEVATSSGGNDRAGQIVVHELGHTIGHLADEYDTAYPAGTAVGEAPEPNASLLPSQVMTASRTKWWQWLAKPTPDGGVIGTFMGGRYNPVLYYRPSNDSIMRELGHPFNLVGREAMVLGFYERGTPLVATHGTATRKGTLSVTTARPTCAVVWTLNGKLVARGASYALAKAHRGDVVKVTVTDTTDWVVPASDRTRMTASHIWKIS